MNVSERRKIHIMAFPHGTPLNVVTSEAQSWTIVAWPADASAIRCFLSSR